MASWLAARRVSPNAISLAGMAAGVAAGLALAATSLPGWERAAFLTAAVLMQLRLTANMLDGMVALQRKVASPVGELFNEVPDRVSDTAAFVGAGYALGGHPVLGYLAAIVALFVAYVRAQGKAAGAHQEFCGPMAKQQRFFLLTVVCLYCGLTPHAWQPALQRWPDYGLVSLGLGVIVAGGAWTALRRLRRIAQALKERQS
jgi:phosphatidylglycerophosphate synthase